MDWSQFGLMVIAGTLAAALGMFLSRLLTGLVITLGMLYLILQA